MRASWCARFSVNLGEAPGEDKVCGLASTAPPVAATNRHDPRPVHPARFSARRRGLGGVLGHPAPGRGLGLPARGRSRPLPALAPLDEEALAASDSARGREGCSPACRSCSRPRASAWRRISACCASRDRLWPWRSSSTVATIVTVGISRQAAYRRERRGMTPFRLWVYLQTTPFLGSRRRSRLL